MKRHSEAGFRLLGTLNEFYKIYEYILAHHEQWDGSGYPKGLKGEVILWEARVLALADAYNAMTCECTYKKALSEKEAMDEIKRCAGTQFDPEIARIFVEKCLKQKW
ncbi:MAG: HD-GYP domain-containing protein [Candidatus Humimicrobiaceae bacterium]